MIAVIVKVPSSARSWAKPIWSPTARSPRAIGRAALGDRRRAADGDRPRPAVLGLERQARAVDGADRDVVEPAAAECRRGARRRRSTASRAPTCRARRRSTVRPGSAAPVRRRATRPSRRRRRSTTRTADPATIPIADGQAATRPASRAWTVDSLVELDLVQVRSCGTPCCAAVGAVRWSRSGDPRSSLAAVSSRVLRTGRDRRLRACPTRSTPRRPRATSCGRSTGRARPERRISLSFDVFAVSQRLGAYLDQALAGTGIRPAEYAVYSLMLEAGPRTPSELAAMLGAPPSTLSTYLGAMLAPRRCPADPEPGRRPVGPGRADRSRAGRGPAGQPAVHPGASSLLEDSLERPVEEVRAVLLRARRGDRARRAGPGIGIDPDGANDPQTDSSSS